MVQNILKVLVKAIKEKRCVAIRYRDQRGIRVIEPHAVYHHERAGIVVDGYQTRGYSASGRPPPFWRPFRIKKISAISMLKETFALRTADGFSPDKLKYRDKLLAIVNESGGHSHLYSSDALREMGPFLPEGAVRTRYN